MSNTPDNINWKEFYIKAMEEVIELAYSADKYKAVAEEAHQYFSIAAKACMENNIPFQAEQMNAAKAESDKKFKEIEARYLMNRMRFVTISDPNQTFMKMLRKEIASDPRTMEKINDPAKLKEMFSDVRYAKPVDDNDIDNILRQIDEPNGEQS